MLIAIIAVLVALAVVVALEGVVVMVLWNYLAPDVLPLNDIGFWEAIALSILAAILFGNVGKSVTSNKSNRSNNKTVDKS